MSTIDLVKEPIYQQLNQVLRSLARSPELPPGSKFLTEREIGERFGVSRATANKALSSLVSEGLLEFRKGVGTFTRVKGLDYNLRALVSFTDEARAEGKEPSTRLLRYARLRPDELPDDVALGLEPASDSVVLAPGAGFSILALERLRLADGQPVILERRWISIGPSPELTLEDMQASLYAVWEGKYGLVIEGADQTVRAVSLNSQDASTLQVEEGSAGLLVCSTGYIHGGAPLWYERTLYRGDAYEFRNRLGPIAPGGQAPGRFLPAAG